MKTPATLGLMLFLMMASLAVAQSPEGKADYDKIVRPFLTTHCLKCHGESKPKGDLRLDTLPLDFTTPRNSTHWTDIMDRMNSGAMPPDNQPRPSAKDSARVVEWIAARFAETEADRLAKRDRVSFYRLSREEYSFTIRDLLGVHFDPRDPVGLADDDEWRGFERIGSVMSLAPNHIEKYFGAAEIILGEAFPPKPSPPPKGKPPVPPPSVKIDQRRDAYKMRNSPRDWERVEKEGRADKVRAELWPGHSVQHGRAGLGRLTAPGVYTFRLQMSGLKPDGGKPPHLVVYAMELDRVLLEKDIDAPEEKPIIVEFQVHLPAGSHTLRVMNDMPGVSSLPRSGRDDAGRYFFSTKDPSSRAPWQAKLTDEDGKPLWPILLLDWIEVKGPLGADGPTFAEKEYLPKSFDDDVAIRSALTKFVERAYRRPARDTDLDRLVRLVESEKKAGETPENSLKTAFLAVLCSKDFLHLVEGSLDKNQTTINDWELASRLSYFLWSTMPDAELMDKAREGSLHKEATLKAQVKRMLADPRAHRFTDSFCYQWLQLRNVGKFPPDKTLYPSYDARLERAMIGETKAFFQEVFDKNLSIRLFLDSDWTMLNGRLAEHYGIPGVTGDDFRVVKLRPEDHRGGLLTQAAVLSLTSDGQRHRPVHRGKWLLETVYGKLPPPPPPNVEAIEPTPNDKPKATIRDKLASHMSHPGCSACHQKFDPLGFAFDNFDAIGRWRTVEVVSDGQGDHPRVNAAGQLADGRKFSGPTEFRKLILDDVDTFGSAFVEKLAIYALRRTMTVDDRPHLAKIAAQSKTSEFRLTDIIERLVVSELFQRR